MLSWLANAWRVPELRRRVLFTAMVLALYRLGSFIPAPGVDSSAISGYFNQQGGTVLGLLNLFSGNALSRFSIFALGIMPYITASIILQLMAVVVPTLAQLQKEGESGYAKINQYTRYLTVVLAAAQSVGYSYLFRREGILTNNTGRLVLIVITLTAGTTLLMWMGEQITKRGIGNGISLLIFASIIDRSPLAIRAWLDGGPTTKLFFPVLALSVIVAVVFIQEGQRRIPIQYAKRQVGRRMTAGGSTYLPMRVNMAGVIPIIFAAAVMAFPPTIGQFFPSTQAWINTHFTPSNWTYLTIEAFLIIVFTYFYTAVQFNPIDQADNLRKYGGYIPGIRPGPPTAQYLDRVLSRLTLPGSLYLAAVAVLPTFLIQFFNFSQSTSTFLGGTSLADHRRRRARHDAPDGVADDDALLRRLPQISGGTPGSPTGPLLSGAITGSHDPGAGDCRRNVDVARAAASLSPGKARLRRPIVSAQGRRSVVNVLLLGPQGSGKGTQAKLIAKTYGIPQVATGDMARELKELDTPLGHEVKEIYDRGELLSDDLIVRMIRDRLSRGDTIPGFILDGFPRNLAQAEALDALLEEVGRRLDVVFEFQIGDREVLMERIAIRAVEEGRTDDTPDAIRKRLEIYDRETAPLVEHYRAKHANVVGIHADQPVDDVFAEVREALEQVAARR